MLEINFSRLQAVIVDFSATWCGPCKMLSPRLDAAVATAGDAVDLAIVDIDENADIADRYGVQAVPTVIAVRDGKVVDKFVEGENEVRPAEPETSFQLIPIND